MLKIGKLECIKQEMRRHKLKILGLVEVRYPEEGDLWSEEFRIIHLGSTNGQGDVALIMEKEVGREVIDVRTIGNRIIAAKIPAIPVDMYIIQVYMPMSRHDEQEIETIHDQLEELIRYSHTE